MTVFSVFTISIRISITRIVWDKDSKLIAAIPTCELSWATDWGELGKVANFHGCRRSGCLSSSFAGTRSGTAPPCPSRPLVPFNVRWSSAARCVSRMRVRPYDRVPFPFLFELLPMMAFLDITFTTSVLHPFGSLPSRRPDPPALPSCQHSFILVHQAP